MTVRPITSSGNDIYGLARLMNQWDDLPHAITAEYIAKKIIRIKEIPNAEILIAENPDGRITGYACVLEVVFLGMDPFVELQSILVDSELRRTGVGRQLIKASETWAGEKGFGKIVLNSRIQLEDSHQFYKSLGYSITKQAYFFSKNL